MADPEDLYEALRRGDRAALGRAITLVESTRPADRLLARDLLERCLPHSGQALRLGITGIPGVGKSTLIDSLGMALIDAGHRVAVLAVDPSSSRSGGSILGDKTRMDRLSREDRAYIRPTATAGTLGGVARRTREVIVLCEAAGYDRVLVETVGIGQNELDVDRMTDLNLLLMIAGAGDELQGIKRGIMEAADVIAFTKAAGDAAERAGRARVELRNAIALLPPRDSGRRPEVLLTSALEGQGMAELLAHIEGLAATDRTSGHTDQRRREQAVQWMHEAAEDLLLEAFHREADKGGQLSALTDAVRTGHTSPLQAAEQAVAFFRKGGAPPPGS